MNSKRIYRALALVLASVILLPSCNAQDASKSDAKASGPAAVTVNGVAIPQARLDQLVNERVAQGQPDSPELRNQIRESLVTQEVVTQEALKQGVDKKPEVAAQLEFARQRVLIQSFLNDYFKTHPVSDEAVKREYDKVKGQMGDKEYKARHILVDNEAEAKAIIGQIKGGAKFEKLATDKSKDAGSKVNGGDLGWNVPGNLVKPFADAMIGLKKGDYTREPVKSEFGWHVIRLEDVRPVEFPALEDVKDNIRQQLQQAELTKLIAELRAKAKVE